MDDAHLSERATTSSAKAFTDMLSMRDETEIESESCNRLFSKSLRFGGTSVQGEYKIQWKVQEQLEHTVPRTHSY